MFETSWADGWRRPGQRETLQDKYIAHAPTKWSTNVTAGTGWKSWFVVQEMAGPVDVHGNAAPKVAETLSFIRMRLL
jgi:hypothetical protein